MTAEKVAYLDLIRTWPGHFLIHVFVGNHREQLLGAGNQAELHQRLTVILETAQTPVTLIVLQLHKGGPVPVLELRTNETNELTALTVPTQPSLEPNPVQIVRGDYDAVREVELETIERELAKHPDETFAHNFLTTVAILRKFRPRYMPEVVRATESSEISSKLVETMASLTKGHAHLTSQLVRRHELLSQGVELRAHEDLCANKLEAELFDITVFWDEFDPARDTWEYAETTAGVNAKRWDDLALTAYALAVRSAPTPLSWASGLEYHFADQSLKHLHARITKCEA